VEIGAEAALFPEKEYISGIFVAVHGLKNAEFGYVITTNNSIKDIMIRDVVFIRI
jgi:hypothetical protein